MARRVKPEDLSEEQLRRLLLDKRRTSRQGRLERYRRTGRALNLALDLPKDVDLDFQASPGITSDDQQPKTMPAPSRRRRWLDRILFGVEGLAILGLALILINGMGLLRTLNKEVVSAWQQNTPEPTPLITAVVLPSGHVAPMAGVQNQENLQEVPASLLNIYQAYNQLPVPTSGPEAAVQIQIPTIKVDALVVQGDNWDQLRKGVGQHLGTPNPGQPGNLVLAGHNDIYGEVFRNLDRLKPGDKVILITISRQFVYIVTGTQIVAPTQVDIMAATSNATLTLISCYPYMVDNKRIAVKATLQNP